MTAPGADAVSVSWIKTKTLQTKVVLMSCMVEITVIPDEIRRNVIRCASRGIIDSPNAFAENQTFSFFLNPISKWCAESHPKKRSSSDRFCSLTRCSPLQHASEERIIRFDERILEDESTVDGAALFWFSELKRVGGADYDECQRETQ